MAGTSLDDPFWDKPIPGVAPRTDGGMPLNRRDLVWASETAQRVGLGMERVRESFGMSRQQFDYSKMMHDRYKSFGAFDN
jgi:hypothetical protein